MSGSLDGPAPEHAPRTVWLQNLAIAVEIFMPAIALVFCVLRAYIRVKTRNLGWGELTTYLLGHEAAASEDVQAWRR